MNLPLEKYLKPTPAIDCGMRSIGELQIEYVRDHGHYQELPLDKIQNARAQDYGAEVAEQLKMAGS